MTLHFRPFSELFRDWAKKNEKKKHAFATLRMYVYVLYVSIQNEHLRNLLVAK